MGEVTRDIQKAMADGEIMPYYQPQFDSITGKLKSAEALCRWVRSDGTIVPPMAFIPEMEKDGSIEELDWHICEKVCRMISEQLRAGNKIVRISVNFSRCHVGEPDFANRLTELTDRYGVPHELLDIEITESAAVTCSDRIKEWLKSVRDAGFGVAIDDFGCGLSSLSFVKDIPADVLKIDKSLLSGNCEDERERIVLECIFTFAHRLGLKTVAEGVETREQLEFLRTCGCGRIQGYIYAKPMPEAEFLTMCSTRNEEDHSVDILQAQAPSSALALLLTAVTKKYPLIIFTNLTRNSFYMMAYENFTATSCPSTGVFDDLIVHGTASMHPDDRQIFADTFDRQHLLKLRAEGAETLSLITRQLGDDGIYRKVETTDYFVKSDSSDDVLAITLCENRE
ncbi:MAG: EAL domain-containing protein [Oscillospiraceae bacterium]|nr:EAL domain-containing protein [Oscillospiraceae bacterium]